jgi:C-terminal processing protease CtpA/Prc
MMVRAAPRTGLRTSGGVTLRGTLTLSVLLLLCVASSGQSIQNPSFEDGKPGVQPPRWFLPAPSRNAGWGAVVTREMPHKGRACVRLAPRGKAAPRAFGTLLQSLEAKPYRGKLVRLRAALRVADGKTAAQMWLRVDRPAGKRGYFDNMEKRPVRSREWTVVEIAGPVAEDAAMLTFGVLTNGPGAVFADTFSLEVVADQEAEAKGFRRHQPPAPATEAELENLYALGKLMGYLRFFHPSDEAASAPWDEITVAGVLALRKVTSRRDLRVVLEKITAATGPTARIYAVNEGPKDPPRIARPDETRGPWRRRFWEHVGWGGGTASAIYSSRRLAEPVPPTVAAMSGWPFRTHDAEIGCGLACRIPLEVYANEAGTTPSATDAALRVKVLDGNDRATRLATVILAWNVFQHFYPYFDVTDVDWDAELRRALRSAATDADERAFLGTLRRLVAALGDGHGNVGHASGMARGSLPLAWDWVDDDLVVTVGPKSGGKDAPRPGDIVLAIDGQPVEELYAREKEETSGATEGWIRWRALTGLRLCFATSPRRLRLRRLDGDREEDVRLAPVHWKDIPQEPRPEPVAEVKPGIWYVDISRVDDRTFLAALPDLAKAKGLVIDFRGYPGKLSFQTFFPYLVTKTTRSPQWHIPLVRQPDRVGMTFRRGNEWTIQPRQPRLTANRVFLADGRAISYAESCMGIVEHEKLGEIVGATTAGTNGNVNPFTLPGGYHVMWTGMKVLKHDGSRHHGVGIRPTVPVSRTREGVAAGRDEVLEKGIEVVSEKIGDGGR